MGHVREFPPTVGIIDTGLVKSYFVQTRTLWPSLPVLANVFLGGGHACHVVGHAVLGRGVRQCSRKQAAQPNSRLYPFDSLFSRKRPVFFWVKKGCAQDRQETFDAGGGIGGIIIFPTLTL